jgi:hypothetical protein
MHESASDKIITYLTSVTNSTNKLNLFRSRYSVCASFYNAPATVYVAFSHKNTNEKDLERIQNYIQDVVQRHASSLTAKFTGLRFM